jgi:hypothetical protein
VPDSDAVALLFVEDQHGVRRPELPHELAQGPLHSCHDARLRPNAAQEPGHQPRAVALDAIGFGHVADEDAADAGEGDTQGDDVKVRRRRTLDQSRENTVRAQDDDPCRCRDPRSPPPPAITRGEQDEQEQRGERADGTSREDQHEEDAGGIDDVQRRDIAGRSDPAGTERDDPAEAVHQHDAEQQHPGRPRRQQRVERDDQERQQAQRHAYARQRVLDAEGVLHVDEGAVLPGRVAPKCVDDHRGVG